MVRLEIREAQSKIIDETPAPFLDDTVIAWLLGGFLIAWLIHRAEKKAAI